MKVTWWDSSDAPSTDQEHFVKGLSKTSFGIFVNTDRNIPELRPHS